MTAADEIRTMQSANLTRRRELLDLLLRTRNPRTWLRTHRELLRLESEYDEWWAGRGKLHRTRDEARGELRGDDEH